jgi:hypothetical protein
MSASSRDVVQPPGPQPDAPGLGNLLFYHNSKGTPRLHIHIIINKLPIGPINLTQQRDDSRSSSLQALPQSHPFRLIHRHNPLTPPSLLDNSYHAMSKLASTAPVFLSSFGSISNFSPNAQRAMSRKTDIEKTTRQN